MADSRTTYGGLDVFKLIAAFLVVAIHISPLTTYTPMGDFLLTRVLARVAVPFFFIPCFFLGTPNPLPSAAPSPPGSMCSTRPCWWFCGAGPRSPDAPIGSSATAWCNI